MGRGHADEELPLATALLTIAATAMVTAMTAGCDDGGGTATCTPRPATPISASTWAEAGASSGLDPFPTHRAVDAACPTGSHFVEEEAYEVDTGSCDYLVLASTLAAPLRTCEVLTLTVAHFPLIALEPAQAHVALAVGDAIAWEREIPIPSVTSGVYEVTWSPPADVPAGTPLVLHLHNHGNNTWYLSNLRIGPTP